ncbi:MAG: hypothetical protein RLZZ507_3215 [Cyanobacteriota bacterium]|jgi:hypothetical protein
MFIFDIICLAKSTKHGGLCIAGIKTDGSGWLRPISNKKDGTLYPEHYITKNGKVPELFDIIRVHCIQPEPKFHQPENWVIATNKSWEIIDTATLEQARKLLNPEIAKHSSAQELLGNSERKVNYEDLKKSPAQSSLALVKPRQLQWYIKTEQNEKKFRANFWLNGNKYDLPITDYVWKSKLDDLEDGLYSCEEVIEILELKNFEPDKFTLTISLGEPFDGFCYKLIAAVINVAEIKTNLGWR